MCNCDDGSSQICRLTNIERGTAVIRDKDPVFDEAQVRIQFVL